MRTWPLLYSGLVKENLPETDLLFVSDYVDLASLVGLVPALKNIPKVLYFHENQLAYPNQKEDTRDIHFGLTHLYSMSVADHICFNSRWNQNSFLMELEKLSKKFPKTLGVFDHKKLLKKMSVIPLGLELPKLNDSRPFDGECIHILWNHRWDHDKTPADFLRVLSLLDKNNILFKLILLGEGAGEHPVSLEILRRFGGRVLHCGFTVSKSDYWNWLQKADVVISTAIHEFFGVSVCEAVHAGCWPLVPDNLAYVEWIGENSQGIFTYHNQNKVKELVAILSNFDELYKRTSLDSIKAKVKSFRWDKMAVQYDQLFHECLHLEIAQT